MAKLKLQPDPTFQAKVAIQAPGANPDPVLFTFKHRDRDGLQRFLKESEAEVTTAEQAADRILEMACGWDLAETFNRESVLLLVMNFITSPRSIFDAYVDELVKAREKN